MTRRLYAVGFALFGMCSQVIAQEPSPSDIFSQQPGRYQIVISPHGVRDTFLLNTATGQVWRVIRYTDMEDTPEVWKEMPRFDQDKSFVATMIKYGLKFTPKPQQPEPSKSVGTAVPPLPRSGPIKLGPASN